jgi:hypothetical protein
MSTNKKEVPKGLRRWFTVHFIADIIFAIPLLFIPEIFMPLFGWTNVDPIMSRLVGAALIGIGVESLLGRNADVHVFRAMLNLKILWASSAVLGIGLGIYMGGPLQALLFLFVFASFLLLWIYYRIKL